MRPLFSRSFFVFSFFFCLFNGIGLAHATVNKPNKVEINIGIYAPFSNEHAFIGRTILGTMERAREQLDAANINYTFYTLDQLPDNAHAANTLQKFIEAHQIQVLVTSGTANGILVAPIARKNDIVHFSMANDPKISDGKNNFLAWNMDYEQAIIVVDKLKNNTENRATNTPINPHSAVVMNHSMAKQIHAISPVSNAFQLIHQSAVLALKTNSVCSGKHLSEQIHALAMTQGIKGGFNVGKADKQLAENTVPILKVNYRVIG